MTTTVELIGGDTSLEGFKKLVDESRFSSFPVVDDAERLKGIIFLSDCKRTLKKGRPVITARHITTRDMVTVTMDETLLSALAKITAGDFAVLPVVDRDDPGKLPGVISPERT